MVSFSCAAQGNSRNSMRFSKVTLVSSVTGASIGGFVLFKEFIVGGKKYEGKTRLDGKTVVVTGANTGIGKEVSRELAKRGARVIMACRDMSRCKVAREQIILDTGNKSVVCRQCDLASLASIRRFADTINSEEGRLDILINNAGVMRCPKMLTKDGFEMQFGVNHLGHFFLTNLLLRKLQESLPSRIVNVSSTAHARGTINFEDLNSSKTYDPAKAYEQSKLANVLFTKELARRLQGTGVVTSAVHPGIVNTEIIRHMGLAKSTFASLFVKPILWLLAKTPRQGAQTILYCALDETVAARSGKYYSNCTETEPAPQTDDPQAAARLWAISDNWTRRRRPSPYADDAKK